MIDYHDADDIIFFLLLPGSCMLSASGPSGSSSTTVNSIKISSKSPPMCLVKVKEIWKKCVKYHVSGTYL